MIISGQETVTAAVQEAMAATPDPRLREVMAAVVRHLHALIRDVRPTDEEFMAALGFLTEMGKTCTATHNEAVLFADVLGASTLVALQNHGTADGDAALLGPFWRDRSPVTPNGGSLVRSATPGPALFVRGSVADAAGLPLAGVRVDVWQASPVGLYENQDDEQADMNLRGCLTTDADGRFWFRSVLPAGYPVPTHGPVGGLLRAQRRRPMRPAHLHFLLHRDGYDTLISQVFVADDPDLETDVVFGVTRALVGDYRRESGPAPAADVAGPWYSLETRFVLQPGAAVLPQPPID
ncbi:MAG: dioxygenase family protein [Ferrovibrionaceae bacterium]